MKEIGTTARALALKSECADTQYAVSIEREGRSPRPNGEKDATFIVLVYNLTLSN